MCAFHHYITYLKKSISYGNVDAKLTYNLLIIKSRIKGDKEKSFEIIKKEAQNNNPRALTIIGDLYATGIYSDFNPIKAEYYYNKSLSIKQDKIVYYKLIDLYKKINMKHKFDNKIVITFNKLIKLKIPNSKVNLAMFYIETAQYKRAIKILSSIKRESKAKYLLSKLTNKKYYSTHNHHETNYGRLLLLKAKKLKFSPQKALLYSFRASLCNTNGAVLYSYEMMKRINSATIIDRIYKNAKQYKKCKNY